MGPRNESGDDRFLRLKSITRNLTPLLRVPDMVEISMRVRGDYRIFFLLNHHTQPMHVQFLKPVRDCLNGKILSGGYDIAPKDLLVVDENVPA